jgi:hypothetical protein
VGEIGQTVLEAVWPTEDRFRRDSVTCQLASLCIATGPAFPEALAYLRFNEIRYQGTITLARSSKASGTIRSSSLLPDDAATVLFAMLRDGTFYQPKSAPNA